MKNKTTSKNWMDIIIIFTIAPLIAFLLVYLINKHVVLKETSPNNNVYQITLFNISPLNDDKNTKSSAMSFAPEMAAQTLIDKKEKITILDILYLLLRVQSILLNILFRKNEFDHEYLCTPILFKIFFTIYKNYERIPQG